MSSDEREKILDANNNRWLEENRVSVHDYYTMAALKVCGSLRKNLFTCWTARGMIQSARALADEAMLQRKEARNAPRPEVRSELELLRKSRDAWRNLADEIATELDPSQDERYIAKVHDLEQAEGEAR
jgi:hypothetical protein